VGDSPFAVDASSVRDADDSDEDLVVVDGVAPKAKVTGQAAGVCPALTAAAGYTLHTSGSARCTRN
jgi:hypothetical protein